MNIAIIGAGFCGLAAAWHLLQDGICRVLILDEQGIGGGASGIAAGLLHPFAGAHAKLNRMGFEGMESTQKLLEVASRTLNQPVAFEKGILRLACSEEQRIDFARCAQLYPQEVEWLEIEECQNLYPFLSEGPGIWIKRGFAVNSSLYLQGLWKACELKGAKFEQRKIEDLEELEGFDAIIVATGAQSHCFPELASYHLSVVKGQVLEIEWPKGLPPIPFALNSHAYLIMNENGLSCLVGATFERNYGSLGPDLEAAVQDIFPKMEEMIPLLRGARVKNCFAGLRSVTPNHLPLVAKIGEKQWVITGVGSKGLLYHSLMAERLAKEIGT